MRFTTAAGASALILLLALAGCSSSTPASDAAPAETSAVPAPDYPSGTDSAAATAVLTTSDSSLGEIVVDGKGMTVYLFDSDTQGATTSACTGQCVTNWPFVTTDSDTPSVEGVTAEVGTIDTPDGGKQVTLDGWPLYYFAGDSAPGDMNGQGVGDVWWVLSPAGEKIGG